MGVLSDRPRRGRKFLFRDQHSDGHTGHSGKFGHKRRDSDDGVRRAIVGELEQRQIGCPLVVVSRHELPYHLKQCTIGAFSSAVRLWMVSRC